MILNRANNAASTLASAITDSATSLDVQTGDGALFPDPPFLVTLVETDANDVEIGWEIILVEGKSGDTLSSLTRGYEGTTASSWEANTKVQNRFTAGQAAFINGYPITTVAFSSSITWDIQNDPNPSITLTGDATLNASNLPSRGQSGFIKVVQDATGGHTFDFGTGFTAEGGTEPAVDETANAATYIFYAVDDEASTVLLAEDTATASTKSIGSVPFSASQTIDFDGDDVQTITVTGGITISTTNRGDGQTLKEVQVQLISDGTGAHTLAFASDVNVADGVPSSVPDGGAVILTIISMGSAETDTIAMVLSQHATWSTGGGGGTTGFTDFSGETTDAAPSNFTEQFGGLTLTVRADAGYTGGKYLEVVQNTADRFLVTWDEVSAVADVELLILAEMIDFSGGSSDPRHLSNIIQAADLTEAGLTCYRSRLVSSAVSGNNNGVPQTNLSEYSGGTFGNILNDDTAWTTSTDDAAGTMWFVRTQAIGTALKVKAWNAAGSQPGPWQIDQTEDPVHGAGLVGVLQTVAGTFKLDYISYSTDPSTTPAPLPA